MNLFAESLAGRFLSYVGALFEESVSAGAFVLLCRTLRRKLKESFFVSLLLRFFAWIGEKVRESLVYEWLGKSVFTEKYYTGSIFYCILNKILSVIYAFASALNRFAGRLFGSSLTYAAAKRISAWRFFSVDVFLALFIGVMFIAPHEAWNNIYAFIGAVFFALWVLWDISAGRIKARRAEGINLSLIVFAAAVAVSVVTATVFSDALRISLFIVSSILLMLSLYASVDTREKMVRFVGIILVFITLTALYGFAQRAAGIEIDLEFVDITANEGMPGRVFSTFSNPNNFAELLLLFIPFFVPLFLCAKSKITKTAVLAAFVITLGALIMTYSRSSWVGFALAAVLFVALYDKRLIIPAALAVLIIIPFMPASVINRVFTIGSLEDSSNSYRLYIWESCIRMVRDYFVSGIGLGPASFKAVYPGYAASVAITAPHSHMLYMELILETGIMGFVSFFAYIYTAVKSAAGSMRIMDKGLRAFAIAALSAALGIAFVCCAEYVWFYPRVMFAFWLIPGILLATARIAKNENVRKQKGEP